MFGSGQSQQQERPLLAQSGRSHGRSTDAAFRRNMSSEGNDYLAELAAVLRIAVPTISSNLNVRSITGLSAPLARPLVTYSTATFRRAASPNTSRTL